MQLITIHADGAQRLRKHYKWPSNAIVVATITEHDSKEYIHMKNYINRAKGTNDRSAHENDNRYNVC